MLRIINLTKEYDGKKVLCNFNLHVKCGQFVGITGESGCGKTTLAKLIIGIEEKDSGIILINGKEKTKKSQRYKYQYIFQNPYNSLNPKLKVGRQIIEGAVFHKICNNKKDYLNEIINICRIRSDLLNKYPSELSGGENQKVAIARALALKPVLIICDEITSSLDKNATFEIMEILKNYTIKNNSTVIFISHEINLLENYCNFFIRMEKLC